MAGRPTRYTKKMCTEICSRIAEGESTRSISRDKKMPARSTINLWLSNHKVFSDQYARAKEEGADALFDDIIDIADGKMLDNTAVQAARLRIDSRKWVIGKQAPKKYGDQPGQDQPKEAMAIQTTRAKRDS